MGSEEFKADRSAHLAALHEWAQRYLEWGFTPLPTRNYLKFTGLKLTEMSPAEIRNIAGTVPPDATGIWLYAVEDPRPDDYYHVVVDVDEPSLADWATLNHEAERTFSYRTARGIHLHYLVQIDREMPRVTQFFRKSDGKHVADVYVFGPREDSKLKGGYNVGVLAYPSAAYDTHSEDRPIVFRELIHDGSPRRITLEDLKRIILDLFGDVTTRGSSQPQPTNRPKLTDLVPPPSEGVARIARILSKYPCIREYIPTPDGGRAFIQTQPGARNNTLFDILAVARRVATPLPQDLAKFAEWINTLSFTEPLPSAEVMRIVQQVVGGGYEERPLVFAEKHETTDRCKECPFRTLCYTDVQMTTPQFEAVPAEGELGVHFPFRFFRGLQQKQFLEEIFTAVNSGAFFVLGLAPTGMGKSAATVALAQYFSKKGNPVIIYSPQNRLQWQYLDYGEEDRRHVPFIVDLGRRHYKCTLAKRYGLDLDASEAPCATSKGLKMAVEFVLLAEGSKDRAQDIVDEVCSPTSCPLLAARKRLNEALENAYPIISNPGLMHRLDAVAKAAEKMGTYGVVILDEAHELINHILEEYVLVNVTPSTDEFATHEVEEALKLELQRQEKIVEDLEEEYAKLMKDGNSTELRKLMKKIRRATNRMRNIERMLGLYRSVKDPVRALALWTVQRRGGLRYAVYVVKSRREDVLREYLKTRYPNLRFVLLTATGDSIMEVADHVVRATEVIPRENAPVFYVPVWHGSQRGKDVTAYEKAFNNVVAPAIYAIYSDFAPTVAETMSVPYVKAIVHENEHRRAAMLAEALADYGIPVFAYVTPQYQGELVGAKKFTNMDEAIMAFKEHKGPAFLVAVALGTGHDFAEDEIAMQFIAKIPFPHVADVQYEIIEAVESQNGEDAGQKAREYQYLADTIDTLTQWLGRVNRKPDQFAATFILDSALNSLMHWAKKYPELAPRVRVLKDRIITAKPMGW